MKNIRLISILFTCLSFIVLQSCEPEEVAPDAEEREMLTSNQWVFSTVTGQLYDNWDPIDYTADDLAGEQNTLNGIFAYSTFKFNTDGTYTSSLPSLSAEISGTWDWSNEQYTGLEVNTSTGQTFFEIELSSSQLVIHDFIEGAAGVGPYVATYIHN